MCEMDKGLPYRSVFCLDLPDVRVNDAPPFIHVGNDIAGQSTASDEEKANRYVFLFTSASTWVMHSELTETLDIEALIPALRSFQLVEVCQPQLFPTTLKHSILQPRS